MKRIISLITILLLLAVQPASAVVMVGFGQSASGPEILDPIAVTGMFWDVFGGQTNTVTLSDNDDGTYMSTSTSNESNVISQADSTRGGTIVSVRLCGRFKATSGPSNIRLRLWNGSTYQSFSPDPLAENDADWTEHCTNTMALNPYTAGAWDATALNALQLVVASSGAFAGTAYCSKVWLEVNY
jgi:hypothetical protein